MPTTATRLANLEEAVTRLEAAVGDPTRKYLQGDTPPAELPNGEYPVLYRQKMLNYAIDALSQQVFAMPAPAPVVVVDPDPSPPPAPPDDIAAIVAALAAGYDVHIVPGKLAIGMQPDADNQSSIQIGGRVAAEISGYSNVAKTDGQNPDEPHVNQMVIADNDGGIRWRQYVKYGRAGKVRNTTNRPQTNVALDSMGDICVSDDRTAYGQVLYIVKDAIAKIVSIVTHKTDWTIEIRESVNQYGDVERKKL